MIGAVIVLDIAVILCLALLDCALRTLRHSPLPRRRHLLMQAIAGCQRCSQTACLRYAKQYWSSGRKLYAST